MDETQKLKERIKSLPKDIQRIINSPHTGEIIRLISKKHHLDRKKQEALDNEVMLVLLGVESIKSLVVNIKRELDIPEEKAQEIAVDVNEYILRSIRESVRNLHAGAKSQPAAYNPQQNARKEENQVRETKPESKNTERQPAVEEERKVEIRKIESKPQEESREKAPEENKIYNSVLPRQSSEEEKTPEDEDDENENFEYHPGTIIDDKLSKIVKLPKP